MLTLHLPSHVCRRAPRATLRAPRRAACRDQDGEDDATNVLAGLNAPADPDDFASPQRRVAAAVVGVAAAGVAGAVAVAGRLLGTPPPSSAASASSRHSPTSVRTRRRR